VDVQMLQFRLTLVSIDASIFRLNGEGACRSRGRIEDQQRNSEGEKRVARLHLVPM